MPPAVGLLMLKRRQSGVNPIRPIKETRADLIRLVLTWLWLTVPDFKKGGGGKQMNEHPCFPPLSYRDRCIQEWLWHNSLGEPETWFGALLSFQRSSFKIANFANDKPGISMGFFAAFFGRETSAKEKKRSDMSNSHKFTLSARGGGAGWTCWPHSLPTHVTVKINGRRQRQPPRPPPNERKHFTSTYIVCAWINGELQYYNSIHHSFIDGRLWRLSASLSVLRLQQRSKMGLSGDVERYHR